MEPSADNEIHPERKSPINWELMEQRSLDAELLKAVLPLFIENGSQHISDLQQAGDDGDVDEIRRIAHTIKGSAANIGAEELSNAALLLGQACRTEDVDAGKGLIQQMMRLYQELQTYISNLE